MNNNIDYNINKIESFMETAKTKNVNLLLFGECYLQGFESLTWKYNNDLKIGIEIDHNIIKNLGKHCKELNISLGVGYIERKDEKLYSSYLIIDNNGRNIVNYQRISKGWRTKYSDDNFYKEGKEIKTFEYMGRRMAIGLCGDFWTDEVIELLPKNIDAILWPVFICYKKNEWEEKEMNEYILRSKRMCKNVFFVNSICKEEKSLAYGGAFAVIENEIKYTFDMKEEGILYCEY
jgi:N-carbamoylputrescine amidase